MTNETKATDHVSIHGDAKYTWKAKLGQISHAESIHRQGKTLCGLKIGRAWIAGSKKYPHIYRAKCPICKTRVR